MTSAAASSTAQRHAEADRPGWSIRIGRVLGIPIDLHVTFLVLLVWIGLAPLAIGGPLEKSLEEGLESVALTTLVFVSVVLHELGHAVVARRFGIETSRILLLPIGGIASLARMPTRPVEELLVAIAGPLVNAAIALGLGTFLFFYDQALGMAGATAVGAPLLVRLLWINVGLVAFNLLPAFPMDGGRVLRAVLSMVMDRARATMLAAGVGRALALALGIGGLVLQPMLALVALFVWSAGRAEASMEQARAAIRGVRARRVMTTRVDTLPGTAPLSQVAERVLRDLPHDYVVEENGALVGLLTRKDLLRGLSRGRMEVPIDELMHRDVPTATPDELLEDVLPRMEATGHRTVVVVDGGQVVGLVDAESIGELVLLSRALDPRATKGLADA